ncbi:hypothetical protein JFU47_28010 [Pseudomonas sp. TH39(2020)]|nr:hypothetical protein [Pseudomonas sp. TH39(2020)]
MTNIVSDTAMSISPPFQGATNASGSYALAPLQGYVKDSADTLRALVNTYGAKLAALGTTGNYDVLPPSKGGTGITDLAPFAQGLLNDTDAAGARSTLVAAKSGANSDITSLAGLTTALSVSQGGTGGTSQSAARTGLGLGSAAVAPMVGTVSQSGGSPTGAIIERGSNAAGEFTKYADGTIVLSGRMSLAGLTWTTGVGVRYASSPNVSIPAPIVSGRIAFHTNNGDVSGLSAYVAAATLGTSAITNIYYAAPSGTSGSAVPTTDYVIHGRWF